MEKITLVNAIKALVGRRAYARTSYAQEAEDLIVDRLFAGRRDGFYIDVGCHHPFRFSNTYHFYRRGWRGLCIDPRPGTSAAFARHRPRDTALEIGLSDAPGVLTYHSFNEAALNTFDEALARERDGLRSYRLIKRSPIPVDTLANVLRTQNLAVDIDLLTIDVEGLDFQVLRGSDWALYRPKVIICECLETHVDTLHADPVCKYLRDRGYVPYAVTGNSVVFHETNFHR